MKEDDTAGMGHNNPPLEELLPIEFKDYIARIEKMLLETGAIVQVKDDEELEKATGAANRARKAAAQIDEDRKARNVEYDDAIKAVNAFFRSLAAKPAAEKDRLLKLIVAYNDEVEAAQKRVAAQRAKEAAEAARIREEEAKELGDDSVMGKVLAQEAEKKTREADMSAGYALEENRGPVRTAGGTVSSKREIKFRIKDGTKIPLAKLKGCFGTAELEKAIREYKKRFAKTSKELPELAGVEFYFDNTPTLRG